MRKEILLLAIIIALSAAGSGQEEFTEKMEEQTPFELVRDWRALAVGALGLSIVLVAIAYMIGIGLEMPEIQGWAGAELTQIIANAIIIISLVAVVSLIDATVIAMVAASGLEISGCEISGSSDDANYSGCLQAVTNFYLSDYVDTAKGSMRNILVENVKLVNTMNTRFGIYCNSIYCAQLGISFTFAADYMLDSDMNTLLFEYYTNLLAFMESQLFFVNEICFKLGPVLLAIGLVARSFYFTRKLGGLLIAVSLGITFFFPGMYLFDWVTLDMAVSGDKRLDTPESECPPECMKRIPIAYYYDGGETGYFYDPLEMKPYFTEEYQYLVTEIYVGDIGSAAARNGSLEGIPIYSCAAAATYSGLTCPDMCRVLPYPTVAQCLEKTVEIEFPVECRSLPTYEDKVECFEDNFGVEVEEGGGDKVNVTYDVEKICAKAPIECKVIRLVPEAQEDPEYQTCPEICKVVPPLKSDCDVCKNDNEKKCCLDSSQDCRVARRDGAELDEDWRPEVAGESKKQKACEKAKFCPASLDANESCVYVVPETGMCEDLCTGCPFWCRIEGGDPENMIDCEDAACEACHPTCFAGVGDIEALNPPAEFCGDCPPERRLLGSGLPDNYTEGNCSFDNCPAEYRMFLPKSACEQCVFSEESYIYNPPVNNKCDDLCKPSQDIPIKDASEYSKIGENGLVGNPEIQKLSKLMLPAYVLPLFNIVATLIFIKGMSGILGGDIEIPGISKVF
ncbi:hypothetical protein GF318_01300 [Candidatus Micrarchaeota archaeon]|nr:hypothetical protein [Candidatus Micrarchaeota archaeon]